MKRIWALLAGIVLVLGLGSCGEITFSLNEKGFEDTLSLSMTSDNELGKAVLNYNFSFDKSTGVLLVLKRGEDFELYYGANQQAVIKNANAVDFTNLFSALKNEANKMSADEIPDTIPLEKFPGTFYAGNVVPGNGINTYLNHKNNTKAVSAKIVLDLEEIKNATFFVIIKYDDSFFSIGYEGDIKTEFFEGELELFDQPDFGALSYYTKAVTFLSTFWADDELADFSAVFSLQDPQVNAELRAVFKGLENLSLYQGRFRIAMTQQFDYFKENPDSVALEPDVMAFKKYFSEFTEHSFDSLYGENRNIYVTTYLNYIYTKNKPLLSYMIDKDLSESMEAPFPYNYRDYTVFSPDDGELLAKNALRYLTWGVEYTPYRSGNNILQSEVVMNEVYNQDKENILEWINTGGNDRTNNYLPGTMSERIIPLKMLSKDISASTTHIIEGDFQSRDIYIYGGKRNNQETVIRQVDLWSAENIAWRHKGIKSVISEGSAVNEGDGAADPGVLYDQEAYTDALYKLTGAADGNKFTWSLGYEFEQEEAVGGIILAYKKSKKVDINPHAGVAGTNYHLKIFSGNGDVWDEAEIKFKEYNKDSEGFWIAGDKKGFSIAEDYFLNNNVEVVYCYLVFDSVVDAEKIKVSFSHIKQFSVDVVEMMVFSENPISYINHSDTNNAKPFQNIFSDNKYYFEGDEVTNPEAANFAYTSPADENVIELAISFNETLGTPEVNTIVVWEEPAEESKINGSFSTFETQIGKDYFLPYSLADIAKEHLFSLTSPFTEILEMEQDYIVENVIPGNPLPFAEKGIDSPRTFAYKMQEQVNAKEEFLSLMGDDTLTVDNINTATTKAVDSVGAESYSDSYVSEIDFLFTELAKWFTLDEKFKYIDEESVRNAILLMKPFLPGRILNTKAGFIRDGLSPYKVDKIAGVDSVGLLSGALSMLPEGIRIYNYTSDETGERLAAFYGMKPNTGVKGLDEQGKPVFYSGDDNSFLDDIYRLNPADIERSTVLIADLKDMRKGDLLVRYFSDAKDSHIGIVVDCDTSLLGDEITDSSLESFMKYVTVVSVRRGMKMVTLGAWGNPENGFGGFSTEPKAYQVRRLLKKGSEPGADIEDNWEMVRTIYTGLSVDIGFLPDEEQWGHWVPNTPDPTDPNNNNEFEKFDFEYIEIKGLITEKDTDLLQGENADIVLLPPKDYGFVADQAADNIDNNIYTNKGGGLAFYAKFENWDADTPVKYIKLASFTIDDTIDINTVTSEDYYEITYESEYFHDESSGIAGTAKDGNKLYVNDEGRLQFSLTRNNQVVQAAGFAVAMIGDFRPGDDFLLRFGLAVNKSIIGTAKDGDFVSIYDKKMLWRANLYIDEGEDDWNDLNPWVTNDNEWLDENSDIEGGQIDIRSWTRYYQAGTVFSEIDTEIEDVVAYTKGSQDPVYRFNEELEAQRDILNQELAGGWDETTAPNNSWNSYSANSYRPNFSSYEFFRGGWNTYDGWLDVSNSSGVDCSGFVQRCMDYMGNLYSVQNFDNRIDRYGVDPVTVVNRDTNPPTSRLEGIAGFNQESTEIPANKRNILIPGDIIIDRNDHVVMICNIDFIRDRRIFEDGTNSVLTIESAQGNADWSVLRERTLSFFTEVLAGYTTRRLNY